MRMHMHMHMAGWHGAGWHMHMHVAGWHVAGWHMHMHVAGWHAAGKKVGHDRRLKWTGGNGACGTVAAGGAERT